MKESDGKFTKEGISGKLFCPKCKRNGTIHWKVWESDCGAYEDIKYTCSVCGHYFWVDGCDS